MAIILHNALHSFQDRYGTGNASPEAKLLQYMRAMREEVLYDIFLDLHKAHCVLERDMCLEILKGYGVKPPGHGGTIRGVIRCPLQGIFGGNAGIPPIPHDI